MLNLLDLAPADAELHLREFAVAHGHAAYRGGQVIPHLSTEAGVASFADMTDLPGRLPAHSSPSTSSCPASNS